MIKCSLYKRVLSLSVLFLMCYSSHAKQSDCYTYRLNDSYTGEAPMLPFHETFKGTACGCTNPFSPDPMVGYKWSNTSQNDKLELYELYPVKVSTDQQKSFKHLKSLLTDHPNVTVLGEGEFMIDFGVESAAWIEIESPDMTGDVEMSISEYTEPAILNAGAVNPVKTAKPIKYGNTYRLELNHELHEGVRFGWVHVRHFDKPFTITKVRKVAQIKPVNYLGSFECDDKMLNQIWYTGAYSVRTNMLYDYISPILMERSDRYSWAGDAHLIQATALVAFGNWEQVKQNLIHNQNKSQGIESYELYWVKSAIDYYMHTGEQDLFKTHTPLICSKLDHGIEIMDKIGTSKGGFSTGYMGWDERLGAGFENSQNPWNTLGYQLMLIQTCMEASDAFELYGDKTLSANYKAKAKEWFAKLSQDKNLFKNVDAHIAATAINADLLTKDQVDRLYKELYTSRLSRISFSPFNGYYLLQAMAKVGEHRDALQAVDDCWGSQVRYGGTTFFEVFNPSWSESLQKNAAIPNVQCGYTSLCHPWSGGITRWLTNEILGINPITPAYKKTMIKPNPCALEWIKGGVPTPSGIISVNYSFKSGDVEVTIPEGIVATVAFPKRGATILSVVENGKTIWSAGNNSDNTHVYVEGVGAGNHKYKVTQTAAKVDKISKEAIKYPINVGRLTESSWDKGLADFGKDGFVLFTKPSDISKLPDYIKSVEVGVNSVTGGIKPERIPIAKTVSYIDAANNRVEVELGALVTRNPWACTQTFSVDVKRTNDYYLTLYFADSADGDDKRLGCEIYDLNTKQVVSPLTVVDRFQGGRFLTYRIDRDVRIRINHIRGSQALLSGLLFSQN